MNGCISDEELMVRCANGDRRAMDILVGRHHAGLLDFVYRHLSDRDTAADIAQAALLRAFKAADRYAPTAKFRTWLYTIALNLTRDELRRRAVSKESAMLDEAEGRPPVTVHGESPEDVALVKIFGDQVWAAVNSLNENERVSIILKFRQGMTYEEIAEVTGAPSGTVKSWIHTGLRRLRERLNPVYCEG